MKIDSISSPDISIIVPAWNEEKIITEFYSELSQVLNNLKKKSEVIFVDDGSSDDTFKILRRIYNNSSNVKVVKLTKNMGQHIALLIGMHYTQGRLIVGIDADLEYSPSDILQFIERIDKGYDLVFGWRENYKAGAMRSIFLAFIRYFVRPKVHDFTCPFRAMHEAVVKQIRNCGSIDRICAKIPSNRCSEIKVKFNPNQTRRSKYSFFRRLKLSFQMSYDIIFKTANQNKQYDFNSIVSKVLS